MHAAENAEHFKKLFRVEAATGYPMFSTALSKLDILIHAKNKPREMTGNLGNLDVMSQ